MNRATQRMTSLRGLITPATSLQGPTLLSPRQEHDLTGLVFTREIDYTSAGARGITKPGNLPCGGGKKKPEAYRSVNALGFPGMGSPPAQKLPPNRIRAVRKIDRVPSFEASPIDGSVPLSRSMHSTRAALLPDEAKICYSPGPPSKSSGLATTPQKYRRGLDPWAACAITAMQLPYG